uniref:Uncharacterized protein n=1 Tax=Glossina palpalis gambiensis TaxID=67801 RepID=A0A1B0C0P8_9MUSC
MSTQPDSLPADVASPDLAIIEDDLNLEELMKQKALLQARLGAYMSDTEGDDSRSQREMEHTLPVKCTENNESDVILLDDSSGDRCTPERFDRQQNTVRQMDESGEKRTAHETSPLYAKVFFKHVNFFFLYIFICLNWIKGQYKELGGRLCKELNRTMSVKKTIKEQPYRDRKIEESIRLEMEAFCGFEEGATGESATIDEPLDHSSASSTVLTRNNKEVGLSVSGVGKQNSITLFLPMRFTDAVADCAAGALLLLKENVLRFTAFSTDGLAKPKLFTGESVSLVFSETKLKVVVALIFTAFASCDLSFTPKPKPFTLLSVSFELVSEIGGITVTLSTVVAFIFEPLNWNVFGGVIVAFVTPEPYSERLSVNFENSMLDSALEVNENEGVIALNSPLWLLWGPCMCLEILVPEEKLLDARVLVGPFADTGSFEMNAKGGVLEVPVSLHRPAKEPNIPLVESAPSVGFVMLT